MSLVLNSNVFDPLSQDVWTSNKQCPIPTSVRIGWKETPEVHVFNVDLPDIKKEAAKR